MPIHKLSALLLSSVMLASGQDAAPTETRAGQIEAAEAAKAAAIQPETPPSGLQNAGAVAGRALKLYNGSRTGSHGLSLRLGGLPDRSGLALGPDYELKLGELYSPDLIWDSYVIGSLQGYYRAQTSVELPRLLNDRAFFSTTALRFDYPRLSYFGEGPDSRKTGRTDYRMQDDELGLNGGLRLRHLQAGIEGAFQNIDIRAGTADGIGQTASTYGIPPIEGRARGADFLSGGFFVRYDDRDVPRNPRHGTLLSAEFQNIDGRPSNLGQFNRYDFELQEYVPFWNERRVIALRWKSVMTTPHSGSTVPFYLEPTLGGSSDLRGFEPYRFHDRNSAVATVEYRWTVMQVLDMALFGEAGKVYRDAGSFSIAHVQTDIGVGLRAKAGENVPFRIDVGCSREGVQFWLTFFNVF